MQYFSLNKQSAPVSFKQATILGQAPDRGLYFPESIPQLDPRFIANLENFSNEAIAYEVIKPYVGTDLGKMQLQNIVEETVNFNIPLVPISENIFSLELFHGPTLAFKDIGARFMSRCLGAFVKGVERKLTVLVATSGDTGGAVASGFYDVPGIEVVILYPSGKVSSVQEKQLTTLGKNIKALEVNGSFDDCQQMVKQAFTDEELNSRLFLTSANSINVARWLPQQFYYFFAYKQWKLKEQAPVICVPSGNFGNICAGVLAHISGLPVCKFIAACNLNDTVPRFLESGTWQPKTAISTLSNAMDVAIPSNFVRIMELLNQQLPALCNLMSTTSITDAETLTTIKAVKDTHHYLLDPHGAVAYLSLQRYLKQHPEQAGFILETAHPVKFPEAIFKATNEEVAIPEELYPLMEKQKISVMIEPVYEALKAELNG